MERLRHFGLVVAGGMIGSLFRFWAAADPGEVPWQIFGINLVGTAIAGWLVGRIPLHSHRARWLVPIAVVGATGAFTTFSALTFDAFMLVDAGRLGDAAIYSGASLLGGPLAASAGLRAGARS